MAWSDEAREAAAEARRAAHEASAKADASGDRADHDAARAAHVEARFKFPEGAPEREEHLQSAYHHIKETSKIDKREAQFKAQELARGRSKGKLLPGLVQGKHAPGYHEAAESAKQASSKAEESGRSGDFAKAERAQKKARDLAGHLTPEREHHEAKRLEHRADREDY